jgi:hypothetical protein
MQVLERRILGEVACVEYVMQVQRCNSHMFEHGGVLSWLGGNFPYTSQETETNIKKGQLFREIGPLIRIRDISCTPPPPCTELSAPCPDPLFLLRIWLISCCEIDSAGEAPASRGVKT